MDALAALECVSVSVAVPLRSQSRRSHQWHQSVSAFSLQLCQFRLLKGREIEDILDAILIARNTLCQFDRIAATAYVR